MCAPKAGSTLQSTPLGPAYLANLTIESSSDRQGEEIR